MSDTTCLLNIHVVAIYMFCIYRVVCQDILNKLVYINFFMTYCTINFHCTLLCSLYSHQQCVYLHSVLIASADTADLYINDCMYFNCKGVGGARDSAWLRTSTHSIRHSFFPQPCMLSVIRCLILYLSTFYTFGLRNFGVWQEMAKCLCQTQDPDTACF